jgi:hypothetical protein
MDGLCEENKSYPPEAPVIRASRPEILLSTILPKVQWIFHTLQKIDMTSFGVEEF